MSLKPITRLDSRHGHRDGGPRRTLDEAALRAEQRELRATWPRSAKAAARLNVIGRQLRSIENRSPWK